MITEGVLPEGWIVTVMLGSDGLHLRPAIGHKPGQLLSHLTRFLVRWGGDFKQSVSTGVQLTQLLGCHLESTASER